MKRCSPVVALISALSFVGCHSGSPLPVEPLRAEGAVLMWDRALDLDNERFEPWVEAPVRGVLVHAVDEASGRVLAQSVTDASGNYALTFDDAPERWFVRVFAALEGESLRAEIFSESNTLVGWTLRSELLRGASEGPVMLRSEAGSAINGALHVADTLYRVDRFLVDAEVPSSAQPALRLWWSPAQSFPCGSCFVGAGVWLGGAPEDPDEYDDQIVMHEAFHFLSDAWEADTSPGGRHVGDPLNPTLAWGEGMATALALMTSEDPLYVDFRESYVRVFEVEAGEDPRFWGTYAGGVAGDVSEYLVAALLWDLFDGDDAHEAPYSIELSTAQIVRVLREWMPRWQKSGVGHSGLDLADFVAGVHCLYPEVSVELQKALDHRRFPLALEAIDCARPAAYPYSRLEPTPPEPLTEPDVKQLRLVRMGERVELRHPVRVQHAFEVKLQREGQGPREVSTVACEGTPCVIVEDFAEDEVVIVTGAWERQEPFGISLLGMSARDRLYGDFTSVVTPRGRAREYQSVTNAGEAQD